MLGVTIGVQVPQSDHHDDGYNPTNYYRTSMDGKKLHASGNSADDLTELAQPQPKVCIGSLSKYVMPSAAAGCRIARRSSSKRPCLSERPVTPHQPIL